MLELQGWWEVPCIAHFCSLFRASFHLPDFDIEELEEALLTEDVEEVGSGLLQELVLRLLQGCEGAEKDALSSSNYQMYLRRLFRLKCQEDVTRKNPFDSDVAFLSLPLRTKVEILSALCDFRLDSDDITDLLKTIESESLRVEPLGQDSGGSTYWYFYGTRLYREDYTTLPKGPPKKRGRAGPGQETVSTKWQVVCFTEQDWQLLTSKFKNCKHKDERILHQTLKEDFLPELARLFAEKEKVMRNRVMEKQLRRKKVVPPPPSPATLRAEEETRARERREQEEADHLLAQQMQREERKAGLHLRERRGTGAGRSVPPPTPSPSTPSASRHGRMTNNSQSTPLPPPPPSDSDSDQDTPPKSRKKLPPIPSPPKPTKLDKKTKVKTSVLFCGSDEDVEIGMHKVVECMKSHRDAWPFVGPVDEDYAPNYYKVIPNPMDLQTMEDKLDNQEYLTLQNFRDDFRLLVANCHKYNGETSEYTEMVENLEEAFEKAIRRFILPDESDDEMNVEYAEPTERKKPRLTSTTRLKKPRPPPPPTPPSSSPSLSEGEESSRESSLLVLKSPKKGGGRKKEGRRLTAQTLKSVEMKWKKKAAESRSQEAAKEKARAKSQPKSQTQRKEERKDQDPKHRPVKKRPRPTSPNSHHKHSKTHHHPPPPPPMDPQKDLRQRFDLLKSEVSGGSLNVREVSPVPKKQRKPTDPTMVKPPPPKVAKGSRRKNGLVGVPFKPSPASLHMKRLQVGKATKFKISRSSSHDMDHSKTREPPGTSRTPQDEPSLPAERREDKKRCLLLNDPPLPHSPALSFGTILPKHALPLRTFKPKAGEEGEEESQEPTNPLPPHPTQEDILERLEKTFGSSLAPHTKDTLAKVILAPDAPLPATVPPPVPPPPPPEPEPEPPTTPAKTFSREKSLPNLSAWFKAFGLPGKGGSAPLSPSGEKGEGTKFPSSKFMVMGRGIGGRAATATSGADKGESEEKEEEEERKGEKEERKGETEEGKWEGEERKGDEEERKWEKERRRRMSTSSLSSQSEMGSPYPTSQDGTRWTESSRADAWGSPAAPQSQQPNSPFSPQTPQPSPSPHSPAPVRVGFYQDYNNSSSSPDKTTDLNVTSPATPPTPNAHVYNLATPAKKEDPYVPLRTTHPEYRLDESLHRPKPTSSNEMGAGPYPTPTPTPPAYHPPIYGIPEAHANQHHSAPRYAHHAALEPQAAHQQFPSREPSYPAAPYAHQHSHPPSSRSMPPVYNNPNERFYKGLLSSNSQPHVPQSLAQQLDPRTSLTLVTTTSSSAGRRKTDKTEVKTGVDLNGFQWTHNLASLTQIVNSIPNAMSGYMGPHYAHAAHGGGHESPHAQQSSSGYTSLSTNPPTPTPSRGMVDTPPEGLVREVQSPRRSTSKTGSKGTSRSGGGKSGSSGGGGSGGLVPGSAFNFSSLAPAEQLALFSKDLSDYSAPSAHHAQYSAPSSNFHPPTFGTGRGGPASSVAYTLTPFHPSAYGTSGSQFQPTTSPRGMVDPYLFPPSSHVMGLLPPPTTHYPPPYPHPHSLPYRQGWI